MRLEFELFLEYLKRAEDVDGDVLRASKLIGCSKSGFANRLRKEFGTASIGGNQVLLRPMKIRDYKKRWD